MSSAHIMRFTVLCRAPCWVWRILQTTVSIMMIAACFTNSFRWNTSNDNQCKCLLNRKKIHRIKRRIYVRKWWMHESERTKPTTERTNERETERRRGAANKGENDDEKQVICLYWHTNIFHIERSSLRMILNLNHSVFASSTWVLSHRIASHIWIGLNRVCSSPRRRQPHDNDGYVCKCMLFVHMLIFINMIMKWVIKFQPYNIERPKVDSCVRKRLCIQ